MPKKTRMKGGMADRPRILIVDDHPLVREGITRCIEREGSFMVCGEAGNAQQALEAIEKLKPDLTIMDLSLENTDGTSLIKDIKTKHPNQPVLILSIHEESLYAERALRTGAMGYVMKQESPDRVMDAVRQILNGMVYLSPEMVHRTLCRVAGGKQSVGDSPSDCLSNRELEVFQLLGQGRGTRQIAEGLHLSVKTVESYRACIKKKLNLKNAMELVRSAVHWQSGQPVSNLQASI